MNVSMQNVTKITKTIDKRIFVTYNGHKDTEGVRKAMSEELKRLVEETVTNMKQMDRESLLIMKINSEVLKIRDSLDKTNSEKRAG